MELSIVNNNYSDTTVAYWQQVWRTICEMAYRQTYIIEEIITKPVEGCKEVDESEIYNKKIFDNYYDITLDCMWKKYSKQYGTKMPFVVPMFKKLHVPRGLFEELGIRPWFKYSFPNCVVTFWQE